MSRMRSNPVLTLVAVIAALMVPAAFAANSQLSGTSKKVQKKIKKNTKIAKQAKKSAKSAQQSAGAAQTSADTAQAGADTAIAAVGATLPFVSGGGTVADGVLRYHPLVGGSSQQATSQDADVLSPNRTIQITEFNAEIIDAASGLGSVTLTIYIDDAPTGSTCSIFGSETKCKLADLTVPPLSRMALEVNNGSLDNERVMWSMIIE